MKRKLLLIAAILGIAFQALPAQDTAAPPLADTTAAQQTGLQFYPSQSVEIRGLLGEGESFTSYLLISSGVKIELTPRLKPLKDAAQSSFLNSDYLSASPSPLSIEAGQSAEFSLTVQEGAKPGNYSGEMELADERGGNTWTIPIVVNLRRPANARIYPDDEAPMVNTASYSPFNFLLPKSIRQEGVNIRIDNESEDGLAVSNISFALKGENTNEAFTEAFLKPDTNLLRTGIGAKGLETLSLRFDKDALNSLPNDTYKGEFRVYFKDAAEPLSTSVTVNKRMGAFGAIILLILGIIVGRWIKDLNKAKGQLELMERFVPLRAKVDQLTDTIAQKHLLDEVEALEQEINTVFSDEAKAEVEGKFPPIEKKVSQIRELEALVARLEERIEELELDEDQVETIHQMAASKVRLVRDTVLAGQEEEAKAALEGLAKFLEDPTEGKSRSATGDVLSLLNKFMEPILKKISEPSAAEGSEEKRQPGQLEKAVFWLLNLLSGVKVSARLRYGLMRPVITLATFVVILLLGFNEIYINGGGTFGSEGIMDYLKLFLWGIISDVFSRSLTDIEAVKSFMES